VRNDSAEPLLQPVGLRQGAVDIAVVGAGIVGVATALELCLGGRDVLLLDRRGVAAEASAGNAGALAFSDILPLASPGMIRRAPGWLLDPLGPLAVRPSYFPQLLPWLWRFWKASRPGPVAEATRVQAALMALSATSMRRLLDRVGATHFLRDGGNLHLYQTRAAWQASLPGWEVRSRHGIAFTHHHDLAEMLALQAGLAPIFAAATFVPAWQTVLDPLLLTQALATSYVDRGGALCRADVQALRSSADTVDIGLSDGKTIKARRVVVCAGAWSHRIAATLFDRIPLETERGYNTTLPAGSFDLRRQLTFPEHGFVVTPVGSGVRVGGGVEFAGLEAAPRFARADALLAKAKRFLPGMRLDGKTQWMGFRPSLPDSLPVIGVSPSDSRVIYAFGHGHLGLTQSAATATLVRELIEGASTSVDLQPLSASRFS
jgi:D-amino-acid dehydrogenase